MRILLDTHALLWWLYDDNRLSQAARSLVSDNLHQIYVSSVSAWEIATKHRLGRLRGVEPLVTDMSAWIGRAGFREMSLSVPHAHRAGSWQVAHRDPFDRMLAAQSTLEDLPLMSRDPAFEEFGIRLIW